MFKNMQISTRLITLVSGIAILMLGATLYASISNMRAMEHMQADFQMTVENVKAFDRIVYLMTRNRVILMDAGINLEPVRLARREAEFYKNRDEITEISRHYQESVSNDRQRELLEAWRMHRAAYVKEGLEPMLAALKSGNVTEASRIEREKVSVLNEPIKEDIDAINSYNIELKTQQAEELKKSNSRTQVLTLVIVVVLLLVTGYFAWLIIRSVTIPAAEMSAVMGQIAADGDITRRVRVQGRCELGRAAKAFNMLMGSFSEIIAKAHSNADNVAETAVQLAASLAQVTQSSQAQSEAAAAMAASMEEMSVSIASVADNTTEVRNLSRLSIERTREGNSSTHAMITEIGQIEQSVNLIAGAVSEFIQSAGTIASMTQQVKDIADQTNLLALNAAIEAARAGEQGRGFAVVADEVRKLAEKSAQSANEIDKVTHSLGEKSEQAEKSVQNGLRSLQAIQHQIELVSSVLKQAGQAVEQANAGVGDIAVSVAEQSAASNDIARHVEGIAQMAETNHLVIAQAEQGSKRLGELSVELQRVVARFEV
ncbi:MAG TPA: methyl-accepting chemotaxis protein [Gallionellaceae bacterium]|nr:methyl-accepting chemotaxis protein [Gallionellaceae bacterium]